MKHLNAPRVLLYMFVILICFVAGTLTGHYLWPLENVINHDRSVVGTVACKSEVVLDENMHLTGYNLYSNEDKDSIVVSLKLENGVPQVLSSRNEWIIFDNENVMLIQKRGVFRIDTMLAFSRTGQLETIYTGVEGRIDTIVEEYDPTGNRVVRSDVRKGNGFMVKYRTNEFTDTFKVMNGRIQ